MATKKRVSERESNNTSFAVRMKKYILSKINSLLRFVDPAVPKKSHYWILPVYFIGKGNFSDNMLAIFETIKDDPKIKKIILTKEKNIKVEGKNTVIIPMGSWRAVWFLLRAKVVFVQHSIWLDLLRAKFQIHHPRGREVIQLWHGVPIKDLSHKNTGIINERSKLEMKNYKVITSSSTDKKNMKKAFWGVKEENFWITGIPRNDFLIMEEEELPGTYKEELRGLRTLIGNKKLIVYAPTYRETNADGRYYEFTEEELNKLEDYLIRNDAILGVRYHIFRKPDYYKKIIQRKNIVDLSAEVISDIRLVIRESHLVITDYSSLYVDATYINKKCISFAYDFKHYLETQRGFFYDFETIFPGEICLNFNSLLEALERIDEEATEASFGEIKRIQNTLFENMDRDNSQRVVDRVKSIL